MPKKSKEKKREKKKELKQELELKKLELKETKRKHEKELEKKKRRHAEVIEKHEKKVRRKVETKIKDHEKILEKKKKKIQKKKEEKARAAQRAIGYLERQEKEIERVFLKRKLELESGLTGSIEAKQAELEKKSAKDRRAAEQEIESLKKKIISTEKRVYTGRQKFYNILAFIVSLYVFIFSVILIKEGVLQMGGPALKALSAFMTGELRSFGAGWLGAFIFHSGSVVAVTANTLAGAGAFSLKVLFFVVVGTIMGNISTPIFVAVVMRTRSKHDLRHGFELAMANIVFGVLLALLVIIVELATGLFTRCAESLSTFFSLKGTVAAVPGILDIIIAPAYSALDFLVSIMPGIKIYSHFVFIAVGVLLFIASIRFLPSSILRFFGGKARARSVINKYFSTPWRSFLIGFGIVIVIASSSMALSLLVPLAVLGIVDLKRAIPYIIGINMGTSIDVVVAGLATGIPVAFASSIMFALICGFSIFFMLHHLFADFIYRCTRLLSTSMRMERSSILWFLLVYFLIPAVLMLF